MIGTLLRNCLRQIRTTTFVGGDAASGSVVSPGRTWKSGPPDRRLTHQELPGSDEDEAGTIEVAVRPATRTLTLTCNRNVAPAQPGSDALKNYTTVVAALQSDAPGKETTNRNLVDGSGGGMPTHVDASSSGVLLEARAARRNAAPKPFQAQDYYPIATNVRHPRFLDQ